MEVAGRRKSHPFHVDVVVVVKNGRKTNNYYVRHRFHGSLIFMRRRQQQRAARTTKVVGHNKQSIIIKQQTEKMSSFPDENNNRQAQAVFATKVVLILTVMMMLLFPRNKKEDRTPSGPKPWPMTAPNRDAALMSAVIIANDKSVLYDVANLDRLAPRYQVNGGGSEEDFAVMATLIVGGYYNKNYPSKDGYPPLFPTVELAIDPRRAVRYISYFILAYLKITKRPGTAPAVSYLKGEYYKRFWTVAGGQEDAIDLSPLIFQELASDVVYYRYVTDDAYTYAAGDGDGDDDDVDLTRLRNYLERTGVFQQMSTDIRMKIDVLTD
jgi:hypothetical protein